MALKLPVIVAVDDDQQVIRAIQRDLKNEYRQDYRIFASDNPLEVLDALKELKLKNEPVAMIVSDQRMPEMEGVELLDKAKEIHPAAKTVLLTAYSDTEAAIKAINEVKLDYYLMKPWDPPEEKLYPVLNDLLDEWQAQYKPSFEGIKLVGFQWSPKTHYMKDYLASNLIPYKWIDIETAAEAKELLVSAGKNTQDLPLLIFIDGSVLANPSVGEVAGKLGRKTKAAAKMYDVVIIGAGPSGLAASVYGASEGLKTLLIEKRAPGGQAGSSTKIENYLGFPTGLSGSELARRALLQAQRFGTEVLSPQEVSTITTKDNYRILKLCDGGEIQTKSVVITTGVTYRTLDLPGSEKFTGAGLYYGSAGLEAVYLKGKKVFVVGGGNSAGQAALHLSRFASKTVILVRGNTLSESMSNYLVEQIDLTPNIKVVTSAEITGLQGEKRLKSITYTTKSSGESVTEETPAVFVFIGAKPTTEWVNTEIIKDTKGYIVTGRELIKYENFPLRWKANREPYLLETSIPGIFASGDVRSGAMARVASAVGEGAMAIKFIHQYLVEV